MRLDAIGEAVFFADVQAEARAHGWASQYVVEHHDGHAQRTAELRGDVANDAVAQVIVAFVVAAFGLVAFEGFAFFVDVVCGLASEVGHGQALKLREADTTDTGQNHLVGAVVVGHEVEDVLTMESFYQFAGTQYVA